MAASGSHAFWRGSTTPSVFIPNWVTDHPSALEAQLEQPPSALFNRGLNIRLRATASPEKLARSAD